MKRAIVCVAVFLWVFSIAYAAVGTKVVTDPESGARFEYGDAVSQPVAESIIYDRDNRIQELWYTTDEAAICGNLALAEETGYVAAGWYLNNVRMSMYQDSNAALWDYTFEDPGFDYPLDMTPEGYAVLGAGSYIWGFNASMGTPVWEHQIVGASINNVFITNDGAIVYCSGAVGDHAEIKAISISEGEIWSMSVEGSSGTLSLSGDNQTLVFTQYGGDNSNMIVLNAEDGNVLFTDTEYNQNPPAISYDGSIIVNGDYSGYIHVYGRTGATYEELWNYHVNGSSAWVGGMAVSGDGSTIAVGTLMFLSEGYDGEVYVFDVNIPEPLWIYQNCGDYVVDVDISYDGSVIAAGGYGPLDHSGPDFYLFRRGSSEPIYTLNTPGSISSVELSDDAGMCMVGGKAVHARVMGSGGLLYSLNATPEGGFLMGNVTLDGFEDHSQAVVEVLDVDDYMAYTDETGDYLIRYVPAQTYMVKASKTGFQPVTVAVSFNEGEIANADFTLTPNGMPPTDLVASQSYAPWIRLDWDPPEDVEVDSYNIYRKDYLSEPFPAEPIGSATSPTFDDYDVTPLEEYHYVVTAIIDGVETPYSSLATGWCSTSHITNRIDAYVGTVPTIDGSIDEAEWADAFLLYCGDVLGQSDNLPYNLMGVTARFKVDSTMENLYIAVSNGVDGVFEDHDEVGVYIDDNNDGVFPANGSEDLSEGNFWAVHYASGDVMRYRPCFDPSGVGTVEEYTDWQVAVVENGTMIDYEFAIPIGNQYNYIQPGEGNVSGIGLFVLDDPSTFNAWWPATMMNIFKPQFYGEIHFGAENTIPPAAVNLNVTGNEGDIVLSWEMEDINDFAYMNVYMNNGEEDALIGTSHGLQFFYMLDDPGTYEFYVVTVDNSGLESDPSATAQYIWSEGAGGDGVPAYTGVNAIYPNPFNPEANISFSLKQPEKTSIEVFNVRGQKVRTVLDETMPAGTHHVVWNGIDNTNKKVASGVYLIKFKAGNTTQIHKALLLK